MVTSPFELDWDEWSSTRATWNGDCFEWKGAKNKGYGYLTFLQKNYGAHRFSFMIAHKREPDGLLRHECDNPPCINPAHLREGDDQDNANDMMERGRSRRGAERATVLTEEIVREMRTLKKNGATYKSIAERFGCSFWTARSAIVGLSWKYLEA